MALVTGTSSPWHTTNWILSMFQVRFRLTSSSARLATEPIMILSNHRSWTDFFIDQVLTGGGSYLSRYMVALGVPIAATYAWLTGSTWFFNRRRGISRDWLTDFFRHNWKHVRPGAHAVIYPEGHRNLKKEPLKLKTGCLQAAYDLGTPVQVVITTNKERVVNEKTFRVSKGVRCVVHVSDVLVPDKARFKSHAEWFDAVGALWDKTWAAAYGATDDETRPLDTLPLPGAPVPRRERCVPDRLLKLRLIALAVVSLVVLRFVWA